MGSYSGCLSGDPRRGATVAARGAVSEGLYDREELLCREGGAADQSAIDVGLSEELKGILPIAGATVEDRGLLSDLLEIGRASCRERV